MYINTNLGHNTYYLLGYKSLVFILKPWPALYDPLMLCQTWKIFSVGTCGLMIPFMANLCWF